MSDDCKISTNASKAEKDLCRCCHSEGSFKSLYAEYFWMEKIEKVVYSEVLRECFNIELLEMDSTQQVLCTICYSCIQRLEQALKFKRQIQKCEKRFQDVYSGCMNKDPNFEVAIKEEKLDIEDNYIFESSGFEDAPTSNGDGVADAGHGADDGDSRGVESVRPELEGALRGLLDVSSGRLLEYRKGAKSKKNKTPAKEIKQNKVVKLPEPVRDEDVLETLEGVIKVVKGPPLVKPGVHYKQTEDGFQCQKCPATAKYKSAIRVHIRAVHFNIRRYKCDNCTKAFDTIATFTRHKLQEHDIDDRFKCNACEQAFNTKVQLRKHKNSFHMLGVKIKCKECDYETFSKESLSKHVFKHKTVKDFQCKFCKKAFMRKTTMQLHERIHTGDRRKVCSVCGQAFVQKASLNYHMTKYHPEVDY